MKLVVVVFVLFQVTLAVVLLAVAAVVFQMVAAVVVFLVVAPHSAAAEIAVLLIQSVSMQAVS